jgi:hypothetical protein
MKTELDSAWESAIHNAERARKAEAEIERLQAELAEAKKFKDGMLDVLGGACPNDHRSTPFEEFKGCTPCLRDELAALQQMYTAQGLTIKRQQDELAECKQDAERYRWLRGTVPESSSRWARWRLECWIREFDHAIDAAMAGGE